MKNKNILHEDVENYIHNIKKLMTSFLPSRLEFFYFIRIGAMTMLNVISIEIFQ